MLVAIIILNKYEPMHEEFNPNTKYIDSEALKALIMKIGAVRQDLLNRIENINTGGTPSGDYVTKEVFESYKTTTDAAIQELVAAVTKFMGVDEVNEAFDKALDDAEKSATPTHPIEME